MTDLLQEVGRINHEIVRLWKVRFATQQPPVRWPMISPVPSQNGLTVIGCNPALPQSNYYSVPIFLDAKNEGQDLKDLVALEIEARKNYPYYAPFHRLAAELNLPLEHVDLFFYRETNQAKLLQLVLTTDNEVNDFGRQQIQLAVQLLTLSQPKIILVSNAFAAEAFKQHFGLDKLDNQGLYWVTLNGKKVPVFLSGMLSGTRSLDRHSRERLVWHMRHTLTTRRFGI